MKLKMDIFNNIRRIREIKSLSREYMASQLNLSTSGYAKIERGDVDLKISRIQKIADVLEVDSILLFNFDTTGFFTFLNQSIQQLEKKQSGIKPGMDPHTKKYIQLLEEENQRLNALLG